MYNNDDYEEKEVSKSNGIMDFYYSNKKLIWILGAILLIIIIVSIIPNGKDNDNDKPSGMVPNVTIVSNKETLSLNNSTRLIAGVNNVSNAILTWKSSDPKVVSVDNAGLITALKYGVSTITATYKHTDNKEYSVSCEVTVAEGDASINLTNISFPEGEVMISIGNEYKVPVTAQPSKGYITGLTYASTNPTVASIDETGKIKAISKGITVVRLSANNGAFTDEIVVNVTDQIMTSQIIINPTSIMFQEKLMKIKIGETNRLSYQYLPSNANISNLTWESSNPSVATVNNGTVTAISVGTTQITVRTLNNVTDVMTLEVSASTIPVTDITVLSGSSVSLTVGQTSLIVPNIIPSDATNKMIDYISTTPSVASVENVNNSGQIKALSAGTTTIILTTIDGSKSTSVTVTVTGGDGGSENDPSDGSSGVGYISITGNGGVEGSYSNALTNPVSGNRTITITYKYDVTNVKYCTYKYGNTACDVKNNGIEANDGYSFTILGSDLGVTVIRYIKYNGSKESSIQERFVNISNTGIFDHGGGGGKF